MTVDIRSADETPRVVWLAQIVRSRIPELEACDSNTLLQLMGVLVGVPGVEETSELKELVLSLRLQIGKLQVDREAVEAFALIGLLKVLHLSG